MMYIASDCSVVMGHIMMSILESITRESVTVLEMDQCDETEYRPAPGKLTIFKSSTTLRIGV